MLRSDAVRMRSPDLCADAGSVATELPPDLAATLREPFFPSALGPVALLDHDDGDQEGLRFNAEEILRWDGQARTR